MAKKESPVSTPHDHIEPVPIVQEMKDSFLAYSMSVITSRALPDVRDGLKPVHRRILYSMYKNNLTASARFKKSATIVGDVLGKYHPHGDSAVYDSMVGMAQEFSFRYPLVIGQGNFGSIDGDAAAAYRYTEAKMSKLAGELMRDINKETVDFRPNFDGSTVEPIVLPAGVPSLLLNGTLGIAVGMATNIPPHHLGEVVDATVALIDNKNATNEDLMQYVQGPDFPTGGVIYNKKDIAHAYATGRGGVVTRGEATIEESVRGAFQIIITSIPYRVNKANLILKIADLVRDKKIQGIKNLRDESTHDIRIVIELKTGINPQRILNYIYKHTDLESNFNFNLVALVDGVPQTLSLKDILVNFIDHRREVIKRRAEFDLRKAEARAHILEGLKKALDHIDEVIKTIKASPDTPTAKANLIKKFKFSDIQAQAILDMRLQKLAGLERKKIEDELAEMLKLIKSLKALLASPAKMLAVVKDELLELKEKYNDERRTRVVARGVAEISDEDLVQDKESALVFTQGGYVKRTDPSEYKAQKRGGVGVVDMETKEEDVVTHLLVTSTKSDLLFFTNMGKVYSIKMYEIPEAKRATKGKSIMNFLQLADDEKVTSILAIPKTEQQKTLSFFFATQKGIVKKVAADQFKNVRRNGLIALSLKGDDLLLDVRLLSEDDDIIMSSRNGQSVRFKNADIRPMGRGAAGVKGMALKKGDTLVSVDVITPVAAEMHMLVVTDNGFGKRTQLSEYKVQNRGGSGIKTAQLTAKTGLLVGARVVDASYTEVIVISKKGQVIRTALEDISVLGRATQGVRIMKLRAGDEIASLTLL
ncbi:MAG: DNA gyrase subunit A [Candidatus Pacebacteria bacterium]|nr:DNA gyrase subunit A [Candidatus Paceibacterota bacterium]MCD8527967.1 DNA gyrase subunit A [Candidatus Paceibacterota bacterium]MCD8563582.1 DNA gyrase subunit A [Candidatus Paceibacterota bacterium]